MIPSAELFRRRRDRQRVVYGIYNNRWQGALALALLVVVGLAGVALASDEPTPLAPGVAEAVLPEHVVAALSSEQLNQLIQQDVDRLMNADEVTVVELPDGVDIESMSGEELRALLSNKPATDKQPVSVEVSVVESGDSDETLASGKNR